MGKSFEQKITEDLDLAEDLLRKKSARETCADCSFKKVRVCRTLSADYPAAPVAVSRWRVAARDHQLSQAAPPALTSRKLPLLAPFRAAPAASLPPRLSPDQSEQKRGRDDDAGAHISFGGEDPLMVLDAAPGVEQETGREH